MDNKAAGITRGIVAVLTLINMVLMMFDINPINLDEGLIAEAVSAIVAIVAVVIAWYKNNDLTDEAVAGTAVTHKLKNKNLSREEQGALHKVKDIK